MGGILNAEVCLKRSSSPNDESHFQHRILGTLSLDVPFLGMHPGVVVSGISSLFRPADASPIQSPDGTRNVNNSAAALRNDGQDVLSPQSNQALLQQQRQDPVSQGVDQNRNGYFPTNSSNDFALGGSNTSISSPTLSQFSPLATPVGDPNYNPRFENDVVMPNRKGWESALHFVTKHSGNLKKATKTYVTSHFEFGGTMADYRTLNERYKKVRALEDIDDTRSEGPSRPASPKRVRFVNYYTASTGRPKNPKSPTIGEDADKDLAGEVETSEPAIQNLSIKDSASSVRSRSQSPRISVKDPEGNIIHEEDTDGEIDSAAVPEMKLDQLDPQALSDEERDSQPHELRQQNESDTAVTQVESTASLPVSKAKDEDLPPIPPEPEPLDDFDASLYENKDVRKLAEKDYARKLKAYKQAVKDREKAIADRQKMIDKREKRAKKEQEKALKADKKATEKAEKEKVKQAAAEAKVAQAAVTSKAEQLAQESAEEDEGKAPRAEESKPKPKRDRKFCITPSKGRDGQRDPTWVRVYMEGVDEVGAHCGLFFDYRPHYEKLVNDVGAKIREWVEHDESVRAAHH